MRDQGCRNKVWSWLDDNRGSNAGLLLERSSRIVAGAEANQEHEAHKDHRGKVFKAARNALSLGFAPYSDAFHRRTDWALSLRNVATEVFEVETPKHQRLVIGLGNSSPLETGLSLHRLYGTPMIPGSALKGIASDASPKSLRDVLFGKDSQRMQPGDRDAAGFITFHDAWILPPWLTTVGEGLLNDVMTPHHSNYSTGKKFTGGPRQGQIIPPTDFDNPTPISFLSVRGRFQIILTCEDSGTDGRTWLGYAKRYLLDALKGSGVGGKGSSGYGRLHEVPPAGANPQ